MNPADLLTTARRLAKASPKKPRQADLRRAVSTAYYALFHSLARNCANTFVGTGDNVPKRAWNQAYRVIDHTFAKGACRAVRNLGFPETLINVADAFVNLQEQRHSADYDPASIWSRADALAAIKLAERSIVELNATNIRDRRAFAVQVALKKR